jgi:hypothetical protein
MRWIPLLILVTLAGSFEADSSSAAPRQAPKGPAEKYGQHEELADMDAAQLKDLLRRGRRELRNRALLKDIRSRYPEARVSVLERYYGLVLQPGFEGVPDADLRKRLRDVESQFEIRELVYYNDDLAYVYSNPPEAPTVGGRPFVTDSAMLEVAESVVAIVERSALHLDGGQWTLTTTPLETVLSGSFWLCDFAGLYEEPSTQVRGTGFLVAPDKVVTAGHVAATSDFLNSVYFLFDYVMESEDQVRTVYGLDDVYEGSAVLIQRTMGDRDWAVVQLDRTVIGHEPLEYRQSGKIDDGASVYMIGHPNGLPQMRSGPVKLEANDPCTFFTARLDSYPYNSGSPVFHADSHVVEGLLVSDVSNLTEYCDCWAPAKYGSEFGLPGARVIRSQLFADYLARPDKILVRCRANSVEAALVITNTSWYVEAGDEEEIDFASPMMLYQLGGECQLSYLPEPGETWDVVDGSQPGTIVMVRCPEDVPTAP